MGVSKFREGVLQFHYTRAAFPTRLQMPLDRGALPFL
jgi:hypothetical protein